MDKQNSRGRKTPTASEHMNSHHDETADTPTLPLNGDGHVDGTFDDAGDGFIPLSATLTAEKRTAQAIQEAFLDERNDVMSVINELEDQLDRHTEIRESMERELATLNEKHLAATQRVQELEWQVVTLQTKVDAGDKLKQDVQAYEEEIADANARAQRAQDQLANVDKERSRLKNELKAATKQLEELWAIKKERDGLRADCKGLQVKLADLDRSQRDFSEEKGVLTNKLQESLTQAEELRTERHQLTVSLRAAEDRVKELIRLQETLSDKIESVRTEKKTLQAQIVHLERENTRLVEQRQFYETEVSSLRNINRSTDAALGSLKKAFAEVRVALTETKTRARRRTIDTWPRYGGSLSPVDPDAGQTASMSLDDLDPRTTTTRSAESEIQATF